jgi:TatA/E family protein of Tat protein translocase
MFGIGAQEMVIIGLLLLVVFGPAKLPGMARDFGRFVFEARRSIEEF